MYQLPISSTTVPVITYNYRNRLPNPSDRREYNGLNNVSHASKFSCHTVESRI